MKYFFGLSKISLNDLWRKKEKLHIKVFITRRLNFRAHIKEPGRPAYEVTVGGKEWKKGKGRQYEDQILIKATKAVMNVTQNLAIDFGLGVPNTFLRNAKIDRESIFGVLDHRLKELL